MFRPSWSRTRELQGDAHIDGTFTFDLTWPFSAVPGDVDNGECSITSWKGDIGDVLVGNATIRPLRPDTMTATVIVRILAEYRRRGFGSEYLGAMLAEARGMRARRIDTVVLASNQDGLAFAVRHGFVEFDRYVLDGDTAEYVDLYLAT